MRPLITLAVLPMLIGVVATLVTPETKTASLIAAIASGCLVFVMTRISDADAAIGWLATLLVLPLPIACSIATVAFLSGRSPAHRHHHDSPS